MNGHHLHALLKAWVQVNVVSQYLCIGMISILTGWVKIFLIWFAACGALFSPANGTISLSNGNLVESIATFTCDVGYLMMGLSQLVCLSSGAWSGSAPTCLLAGKLQNVLCTNKDIMYIILSSDLYEGCSNMNASGFITFFTYMLRQNGKRFYKGLYVTF